MSDYPDFVGGETAAVTGALNNMKHGLNGIGGDLLESGDIYQGATTAGTDAPYHRSKDSGASGIDYRWLNDAGVVVLQLNTGTEGSPVWATCFTLDLTSRKLTVGDSASATAAALHVVDGGGDNKPGLLALYDDAGADYYFWMDSAGNLRFHTSAPADDDADGYVVATSGKANVTTDHDHDGGDGAAVPVAGLAAAVQDLLPNCTISVGAEGADVIQVSVQFRDAANNNLAEYCGFMALLSDTAHGAVSADPPSGGWAAGVGVKLAEPTANLWGWFETNSSGLARIDITEAGVDTWYLMVLFDGKTTWSGAITFA